VVDRCYLDGVPASPIHDAVGADHDLAHVLSAILGHDPPGIRKGRERLDPLEQPLEPPVRRDRVIGSDVRHRLMRLALGEWRPGQRDTANK